MADGSSVTISFKVENGGNRATREDNWNHRVFLSLDASLDEGDWLMSRESSPGVIVRAENRHVGVLEAGDSYTATVTVTLPFELAGPMNVIAMADSDLSESGYAKSTLRSEEHTYELQSLMRISYAVFCFKKKKN